MRRLLIATSLLFLVARASPGQAPPVVPSWGNSERGLRLGLSATAAPGGPIVFEMTFENVSTDDLVLRLGTVLGNGVATWPDAIHLVMTDSRGMDTTATLS